MHETDDIWAPRSREIAPAPRPLPQPGHGFEHEPTDRAERDSEHTAQDADGFQASAADIRAALRPGSF